MRGGQGKRKHRRGRGERGRRPRRSPGTATAHHDPRPRAGRVCPTAHRPKWPIAVRHSPPAIRHQRIAAGAQKPVPRFAYFVLRGSPPGASLDPCRLAQRLAPASAVPPDRAEIVGAGRAGPGFGGVARDETFSRMPQPRASTRSARVEAMRPEPGARPEGRRHNAASRNHSMVTAQRHRRRSINSESK